MAQMQINFKCPLCGGTHLNIPDMNNNASQVSCASCGTEFGSWGEVKANLGMADNTVHGDEKPKFKGLSGSFKPGR